MSIDGMRRQEAAGTVFYRWKIFEPWEDRFIAGLTTRIGGCSDGHLASLNLGHGSDDRPENLTENRRVAATALGLEGYSWSVAAQVHGCRIAAAAPGDTEAHPDTDALGILTPGVIAAVMLADCHPVILYDPERHAALVCHAGWRGTAADMAGTAVAAMVEAGSRRENLRAATGPGIGPCCYQVGDDVKTSFEKGFADLSGIILPDPEAGKWRLDIEAANILGLRNAGIRPENLGAGGFCTACRTDEFYSWRKEKGLTGRQAALVALLPV